MTNTYRKNLLFVCSRNKRRSLSAETIWQDDERFAVKSAGTSPSARVKISEKLIAWAEVIFVMEKRHRDIIRQQFPEALRQKDIRVLNIPDDYEYMQPELVVLLEERVYEMLL